MGTDCCATGRSHETADEGERNTKHDHAKQEPSIAKQDDCLIAKQTETISSTHVSPLLAPAVTEGLLHFRRFHRQLLGRLCLAPSRPRCRLDTPLQQHSRQKPQEQITSKYQHGALLRKKLAARSDLQRSFESTHQTLKSKISIYLSGGTDLRGYVTTRKGGEFRSLLCVWGGGGAKLRGSCRAGRSAEGAQGQNTSRQLPVSNKTKRPACAAPRTYL